MKTLKTSLIAVLLLATVAGATVALADTTSPPAAPAPGDPAAIHRPSTLAPSAFAVFRRAQHADEAMTASVRRMLTPTAERERVNIDAGRVVGSLAGKAVWVIPGPDKICLALPDPVDGFGVNCKTPDEAADGGLWVSLVGGPGQQAGDALVAVFAPDHVNAITAVAKHGQRDTLDVTDNVAVGAITDADTVQFTDTAGAQHTTHIPGTPAALLNSD